MALPPAKNYLATEKMSVEGASKVGIPFLALAGIELVANVVGAMTQPKPPEQKMSVNDALTYELAKRYRGIRSQREVAISMASGLTGLPREKFMGVSGIRKLQTFDWDLEASNLLQRQSATTQPVTAPTIDYPTKPKKTKNPAINTQPVGQYGDIYSGGY